MQHSRGSLLDLYLFEVDLPGVDEHLRDEFGLLRGVGSVVLVDMSEPSKDLGVELVLYELSFEHSVGLNVFVVFDHFVYFVYFVDFPRLVNEVLLLLQLCASQGLPLQEDGMDSEVHFPEDALYAEGNHVHVHDMHEYEVEIDVSIVVGCPEDVVVDDCRPATLVEYLDVDVLSVEEGAEVGELLIGAIGGTAFGGVEVVEELHADHSEEVIEEDEESHKAGYNG